MQKNEQRQTILTVSLLLLQRRLRLLLLQLLLWLQLPWSGGSCNSASLFNEISPMLV